MVLTFREKVEDIVRGFLVTHPATSPTMPHDTIQQPASTGRRDLFVQVAELREQQKRESLPLQVEAASLEVKLNEILTQAKVLTLQLTNVRGREFVRTLQLSTAMDLVLAELRESASPVIADFIAAMNKELGDLNRLTPNESKGVGELNMVTMVKPKFVFSNAPAIRRRALALQAARHRAEELKTIDRSDLELAEEFASLWAGLPVIDGELEQVVGD